ncbi:putative ribonuclease VapC22 [Desulfosarcina variabilis str. Montpellier]|uniref:type II toxin-antitoxin system VapC family toxin n=1 Tax=Desulfosarcina variabilis TaxID=2300 RepID=UPI003AFB4C1D
MILLDTHAWIWFLSDPGLISQKAIELVEKAVHNNAVYISSISIWEIALLVAKKRLILKIEISEWISKAERLRFFQFLPVDNSIALKSVNLPQPLHSDPADRIIIASALALDVPLITRDEKILNYPYVQSVW